MFQLAGVVPMKVLCPHSLFIANLCHVPSLARTRVLRLLPLLAMSQAVVASVGAAAASEDAAPGAVPMRGSNALRQKTCWRR